MKTSTVLKPAMMFAAGSVVSTAASAAPTIMNVNFQSTPEGTEIKLAGSSTAQYNFQTRPKDVLGTSFGNSYNLDGLGGAQVTTYSSDTAFYPTANDPSLGSTVKTGSDAGLSTLAAADKYYGLRFASNGTKYTGYAGLNLAGDTITEIGFKAAVPEPSTWTLLIAGFGGVGLAMRRRRRQSASSAAIA